MKLLSELLYKVSLLQVEGDTNVAINHVSFDSRNIDKFSLFIAIKGEIADGHTYIDRCIEQGAIAIVCETLPLTININVTYIVVKNSSESLAYIASNFYDNPSEKIKIIGITGTNGKTTTTTLLFNLFKNLGYKCGLLSTVKNQIHNTVIPATHTTPDSIQLNKLLAQMVAEKCIYTFMEVSSHSLVQHRVSGIQFTGAIFSNLTHDHLDYHKTFEEYRNAKKLLFDKLNANAFVLTNNDDKNGMYMVQNTKAKIYTYSQKQVSDFKVKILENHFNGMLLNINQTEVWTKLIGEFNAYNLLAAYATAHLLKKDKVEIFSEISNLLSAPGRFENIRSNNGINAIIDYAHTPDALKNVLETINKIRTGNEQVICIVGCGGNRDPYKRPIMAKIAADNSNKIILTSDNPRKENPEDILNEMETGLDPVNRKKMMRITDRKEAIRTAVHLSKPGDIILIAGKGHENYQEINGEKFPFDDMQIVLKLFNEQ